MNETDPQYEDEQPEEELEAPSGRFLLFNVVPSWLVSFVIHVVLIIILAVAYWTIPGDPKLGVVTGESTVELDDTLQEETLDPSEEMTDAFETTVTENSNESELTEMIEEIEVQEEFVNEELTESLTDMIDESAIDMEANSTTGAMAGAAEQISGRSSAGSRLALVRKNGGNAASENAVKLALEWITKHQLPNGSWNFDHRSGPNPAERASPHPGDFTRAPRAATAMCLLVYLGAGQTHVEGEYKEVVEKGLAFLIESGDRTRYGLSFWEEQGALYSHGLAAIALCEAYAMTDDPRLAEPVQQVIRFIEYAQDPVGGGWRYDPKQAGDTSAVGWQVMALKSAYMCGIDVDSNVIRKARRFLDFVSSESGAFYGYTHPIEERRKGVTSVGLLCQMYLGWTRENPALGRGVNWLSDRGPDVGDWKLDQMDLPDSEKHRFRCGMYYNYYATQVMHQYSGELWDEWNREMRDFLIATQVSDGPARGSWFFNDPDEGGYRHGGRLYATTLAAMTLEVYYRYMPLYDEKKTEETLFELD